MNRKKIITAVFWAWLLVCLGVAWFNGVSAHAAKLALDVATQRRAALISGISRARRQIAAAGRDETAPPRPVLAPPPPKASELALLAADPGLYAMRIKAFQANFSLKRGSLYRALGLTPDQIDKFETLAVQHHESVLDIMATADAHGLPAGDPAIATLLRQEKEQYAAAQQVLLGDADYQRLQEYDRALPVMAVVSRLETDLALSSDPITGPQADQLMQILAHASSSYQGGGVASPATINWPVALGQAHLILTRIQFRALQTAPAKSQVEKLSDQFLSQELKTK